nr:hypothetical protein 20 [bacterium]
MEILLTANDNLIKVRNLTNKATGTYANDATVQATLYDSDGNEVGGQTWPLTLVYIADSNGEYQATIEAGVNVTPLKRYNIVVSATTGEGAKGQWEVSVLAKTRK